MNDVLISKGTLVNEFEWLKSVVNESSKSEVEETIQRIRNAPAVEARPVVHGRWVYSDWGWVCSVCGENALQKVEYSRGCYMGCETIESNFCPHCGAKMDKEG